MKKSAPRLSSLALREKLYSENLKSQLEALSARQPPDTRRLVFVLFDANFERAEIWPAAATRERMLESEAEFRNATIQAAAEYGEPFPVEHLEIEGFLEWLSILDKPTEWN